MNPPASPTPSRWSAIALLLAGSVGVPGLVAVFKPEIARSPRTAIPLLILWELLVLIAGLVTDVWSKLRSRWVDRRIPQERRTLPWKDVHPYTATRPALAYRPASVRIDMRSEASILAGCLLV
ncbi:MAG TPA: hypothetical protein VIA62_03845 [Thermoanaerobaculia bacterium]|jgi:hypothetical protein|nr:hypothetical protein [Thermoanaerobaculia bacterium]